MPFSLFRRKIHESTSVLEVINFFQQISLANSCMLVADATGKAVCFESAGGELDIREISESPFAHANSILADKLKPLEAETLGSPSSPLRQANAQRLLEENSGDLSLVKLREIMADHTDFPYSFCRHCTEDDTMFTTAAFIADLSQLEMHIAIGHTCSAEWKRYLV